MSQARFALPSVLTHAQAQAIGMQLAQAALSGRDLVVDASALQQFDSSALAVLLAGMRAAQTHGGHLHVQGLPARAHNLAQVYGLDQVLQLVPQTA